MNGDVIRVRDIDRLSAWLQAIHLLTSIKLLNTVQLEPMQLDRVSSLHNKKSSILCSEGLEKWVPPRPQPVSIFLDVASHAPLHS